MMKTKDFQCFAWTGALFPEQQLSNVSPTSPLRKMMPLTILSKLNSIWEAERRVLGTKDAEKAFLNTVLMGYATATEYVQNTPFRFVYSAITKMAHKGTLTDCFGQKIDDCNQRFHLINAFADLIINSQMFSGLVTLIFNKRTAKTFD